MRILKQSTIYAAAIGLAVMAYLTGCNSGPVRDEAMLAGRTAESFRAADEDYFKDMDGAQPLTVQEARGRNMWNVWTGGNDKFWDTIARQSVGTLDLLKIISSYDPARDSNAPKDKISELQKKYHFRRPNRWKYLGLINEPCFEQAQKGDTDRFGLWLDVRKSGDGCGPDPFENEQKYPGVSIGARGKKVDGKLLPVGSAYGWATGVMGLRLFTNPDFDEAAARVWNATKYYTDPDYYNKKDLVKPYRVGMSCGFCHIGADPLRPPADPENPQFANLSSYVGAQYFWVDRIFAYEGDKSSFAFQLFHTSRAGSLDTSLVSTDNVNNPRTMNAVYELGARLEVAKRFGHEVIAGGGLDNRQFNDFVPPQSPLAAFFSKPDKVVTPRVLKDGSDSVGALGALNRVYMNIGLFSEEWLTHFNALVGGKRQSPMSIRYSREHSVYWRATEAQTPDMALFFLRAAKPHRLTDVQGGNPEPVNAAQLPDGKRVFADRCARCHSSKLPDLPEDKNPGGDGCAGQNYSTCFTNYWNYTKTQEFKTAMRNIVNDANFTKDNFLAAEFRVPVTLLGTNACSPLAANAIGGNVWDNFSSQSYKDLPSAGGIEYRDPYNGQPRRFQLPAGGRGYTRPASLISLWSTAPYLLNNSVGKLSKEQNPHTRFEYNPSPSVQDRLWAFHDGINKLLWPERREKDSLLGAQGVLLIDRTTHDSYLRVPGGYLPEALQGLLGLTHRFVPQIFNSAGIEIGPFPAGMPVNLLANLQLVSEDRDPAKVADHNARLLKLALDLKHNLKGLDPKSPDRKLIDQLITFSTCPDFEVNRGHYFGTDKLSSEEPGLSDDEKLALIEFLKTL